VGYIVRFCFHYFSRFEPRRYSSWSLTFSKLFGTLALANRPLRVKSRQLQCKRSCPLYPRSKHSGGGCVHWPAADFTGDAGTHVIRRSGCENERYKSVLEGGPLMERQCDHLGSSPLSPLVAGNIRSTAPSHIFSAGSFSPARWSVASFTKASGRESFSSFR
jgi:hypothetical protein